MLWEWEAAGVATRTLSRSRPMPRSATDEAAVGVMAGRGSVVLGGAAEAPADRQ